MTVPGYRLAPGAAEDLRAILAHTLRHFGTIQHDSHAALIHRAALLVAAEPDRIGSVDRRDIAEGLRAYPLWIAARRRGASPHILFYTREGDGIAILRILHAGMDPTQHLPS
ncbi:type II toxin-antitoxin system RelE/ParE family toxin [Falsiroseomonas stagni]|uniref:Toxin ParE1/3/4 n=1 Tax=Falsiroseomonas stagni DSM 19981 TaxID=1123062 RepID=A0A1I3Y6L0_9PROT|nr:type II toxin-antitoxin system RelE/ParE family toxin [Falsiroseomonas stagni]SFK26921.1 toxin ParE1/3/4 [Falsiroseomonas stagni DSM 19981]